MAKTIEELQSEIDDLKNGNTKLAEKNAEILDEMKQERKKNRSNDEKSQEFYALKDKYDELKADHNKITHDLKGREKDIAKLTESNQALDSNLQNILIDGGLSTNLAKLGVKPEFMDATKALLKSQVSLVDGKAMVGDKALPDYLTEWSGEQGKAFISASDNSGSGANGGNSSGGNNIKADIGGSKEERLAHIAQKFNMQK